MKTYLPHLSRWQEVVYNLGVLGHFAPWDIFGLRGSKIFWYKESKQKKVLNSQRF